MTIQEIAHKIYTERVEIKVIDSDMEWYFIAEGFEYKVRRIAHILQFFGYNAKALWKDEQVKSFKRAMNHEYLLRSDAMREANRND